MNRPYRILIVEDEMVVALDLSEVLIQRGYQVIDTVPSGEEALLRCSEERPDLVLMDIRLQGELSGLETARRLREQADIPTIVLTAFFDDAMLREAQEAKVLAYLIKPYDERELCATLATALLRCQEEQALRQMLDNLKSLHPITAQDTRSSGTQDRFHVKTLPKLQIIRGNRQLYNEELTRTQRSLLSLVLSAPRHRIDRNELAEEMWPDTSPEKARVNLDSTLARLRRLMKLKLGELSTGDYLPAQHGVVWIEGVTTDLDECEELIKAGRGAQINGDRKAALTALERAYSLWQGEFLSDVHGLLSIESVRSYSTKRFLEGALLLARLYDEEGKTNEALVVLGRARNVDPANELTTTQLFLAYRRSGMQAAALQLLHGYKAQLLEDGLTQLEAFDIIRKIERNADLALASASTPLPR